MSRSFRHTPFFGKARPHSSDKRCKRLANRRLRCRIHRLVTLRDGSGDPLLPALRQLSNVRGFRKGGKVYFCDPSSPTYVNSMRK